MYQAPELMRKEKHGFAVDFWALGCLALEMVTGHSPFSAQDEEATEAAVLARRAGEPLPPPLPPAPPETTPLGSAPTPPPPSAALLSLCGGLLHPSPSERMGYAGMRTHAWFEGFEWTSCLAMEQTAPYVPPALDPTKTDDTLLELSKRCQQGFD